MFEDGAGPLTEEQIVGKTPCGPDPEAHLEAIRAFDEAGNADESPARYRFRVLEV